MSKEFKIEVWETEEDRERGEGFIHDYFYNLSDAISESKKIISREGYASIEVLDEEGNVMYFNDGEIEEFYEDEIKEVQANKYYVLNDGLNRKVFIIDLKNEYALIKNNGEYIVALKPELTEDNKIHWASGSYFKDLSIAARSFESRTNDYLKDMNTLKNLLNEEAHDKYIECVISNELRNGFSIEAADREKLDKIYDQYMDQDNTQLLSEDIYEMLYMSSITEEDESEEEDEI